MNVVSAILFAILTAVSLAAVALFKVAGAIESAALQLRIWRKSSEYHMSTVRRGTTTISGSSFTARTGIKTGKMSI